MSTNSNHVFKIVIVVDLVQKVELFVKQETMIRDQDAMHLKAMENLAQKIHNANLNNMPMENANLRLI